MKRPRRFSFSALAEPHPRIDLNNTDLPGYLTDRLKQLRDIVLQFRPDASIEFTEGYLTESTGFFVVATIDVDDIDDFNPIEEALLEPLAEMDYFQEPQQFNIMSIMIDSMQHIPS